MDSNLCFLEVKNKIKGRTVKSRKAIEDFENTLSLIETVNFINSYSFIFSARPGTVAFDLKLTDKKKSIQSNI